MNEIPPPDAHPETYEARSLNRLDTIIEQNQAIISSLDALRYQGDGRRFHVKIADANMPFFALVGLLVKIALASIPAMLILGMLVVGFIILASAVIAGLGFGIGSIATLASTSTPASASIFEPATIATARPNFRPTSTDIVQLGPLDMFMVSNRIEEDEYIVEGQVKNLGSVALENAVAVVIFRTADGQEQEVKVPIRPVPFVAGATGTFSASTTTEGISSFRVDFISQTGRAIPFRDTAP